MADSSPKTEPIWLSSTKKLTVGLSASLPLIAVGYPLDTVKVLLQVQSAQAPVYTGILDCFIKTFKWEGLNGFYRGSFSPFMQQFCSKTVLFGTYNSIIEKFVPKQNHDFGRLMNASIIAGFISGLTVVLVDTPFELTKSVMQAQFVNKKLGRHTTEYKNTVNCFTSIMKTHGSLKLYKGASVMALRNSIGFVFYFGAYEYVRRKMSPHSDGICNVNFHTTMAPSIMAGGAAGAAYWVSIYPFDVVKSAVMADSLNKNEQIYKSSIDCMKKLYYTEGGVNRFFKGFLPCLVRSAPVNALSLYSVALCQEFFDKY